MKGIEIIKATNSNWYKVGETYSVLDEHKYDFIGIQVVRPNNGREPDVIQHGHYKLVEQNPLKDSI